jgi:hypothetical protein
MSDNTDDNDSLWSNLKNKITYNIYNAVKDPNANKFAIERDKKRKEEENKKTLESTNKSDTTDDSNSDSTNFSIKRVGKKVGNQTLDILKKAFIPFLAIMLAMIVSNEMIIYSVPIRILFFIFTFCVCYFVKSLCILLGVFYVFKGGYSYYINNMTDRPKQEIMPTIYALLPISTYKPTSSLVSFLLYPFTYPKTVEGEVQLPKTMKSYWNDLEKSFKDFDKVTNLPLFVDNIKQIQKDLLELHNPKASLMTFGNQKEVSLSNTNVKQSNVNKASNIEQSVEVSTNNK